MGRKKLEMRRIEDKSSRQVSFSKRRTGLIKKARELSVLCDADVALLIFSARGKFHHFATDNNLEGILKRYRRRYDEDDLSTDTERDEFVDPLMTYKQILDVAKRCLGDLEELSISELSEEEKQLRAALAQTRTRKNEVINESLVSLKEQEKCLEAERVQLLKQIEELKVEYNKCNNLETEGSFGNEDNDRSSQTDQATLSLLNS